MIQSSVISAPGAPVAAILEFGFVRDIETRLVPVLSVLRPTPDLGRHHVGIVHAAALPVANATSPTTLRMDRGNLAQNFDVTTA